MGEPDAGRRESSRVGLCASCTHATVIASARGSVFHRCDLSFTDERFPRYPRLPVLACAGYRSTDPAQEP